MQKYEMKREKLFSIIKILSINFILFAILIIPFDYFLFISRCSSFTGDGTSAPHKIAILFNRFNKTNNYTWNNVLRLFGKVPECYRCNICNREYCTYINSFDNFYETVQFRKPIIYEKDRSPILLFGCSYTYGNFLFEEQTFSYKLAKISKHSVVNRAYDGWGVQHMLYQLQRGDCYNLQQPPKYIIYVFIPDHIRRLYSLFFDPTESAYNLFYIKKIDGELLKFSNFSSWRFLYLFGLSSEIGVRFYLNNFFDKSFDGLEEYFLESKKITDKNFPGSKFVILKYVDADSECFDTKKWHDLEKQGFIILDTRTLTGKVLSSKEYKTTDGFHPNEKAWDLIVPALMKSLRI